MLFKLLFGDKDSSRIISNTINESEKIPFTSEELPKANMARLDWILQYQDSYKGSKLSRRLVAISFTAVYLLVILLTATAYIFSAGTVGDNLFKIVTDILSDPVNIVLSFYFVSGIIREFYIDKK